MIKYNVHSGAQLFMKNKIEQQRQKEIKENCAFK